MRRKLVSSFLLVTNISRWLGLLAGKQPQNRKFNLKILSFVKKLGDKMTALSSIIKSIYYLFISKLLFPSNYNKKIVRMDDGKEFKIFRHMHLKSSSQSESGSILIVRFKFKKFSHNTNIILSRIPILLIAGFPGFRDKL